MSLGISNKSIFYYNYYFDCLINSYKKKCVTNNTEISLLVSNIYNIYSCTGN